MITIIAFSLRFLGITFVFPRYFYGIFPLSFNKIGHLRQIPYICDPHGVRKVSVTY